MKLLLRLDLLDLFSCLIVTLPKSHRAARLAIGCCSVKRALYSILSVNIAANNHLQCKDILEYIMVTVS